MRTILHAPSLPLQCSVDDSLDAYSVGFYSRTRLQQEPQSTIVPITAKYLIRELSDMRQWSREGRNWEEARKHPQTIEWVRDKADVVIIDSSEDMTDVTSVSNNQVKQKLDPLLDLVYSMKVPYFTWLAAITRLITNHVHFPYLPVPLLIDLR
jgi:hypothetical protein